MIVQRCQSLPTLRRHVLCEAGAHELRQVYLVGLIVMLLTSKLLYTCTYLTASIGTIELGSKVYVLDCRIWEVNTVKTETVDEPC